MGSETPGDVGTVRSWDSHANYKHHLHGSSPTHSIFSGVVLYCDETHLKSGTGIIRLLLVVSYVHSTINFLKAANILKAKLFFIYYFSTTPSKSYKLRRYIQQLIP